MAMLELVEWASTMALPCPLTWPYALTWHSRPIKTWTLNECYLSFIPCLDPTHSSILCQSPEGSCSLPRLDLCIS